MRILCVALSFAALACNPSTSTTDPATATSESVTTAGPSAATAGAAAGTKATVGTAAPDFELVALDGSKHSLAQYRGKTVVLEWFNPDCPFVRAAHSEGNLKDTKPYREGDVVWLAINSGAPGRQGHGKATNEAGKKRFGIDYPILLDEDGAVGQRYGAKRTPHMYVVDPKGILVYAGALDDTGSGDLEDGEGKNYLLAALTAVKAGEAIETAQTKAWGCSVKYAQ